MRFTSAGIAGALERIQDEVSSWPGVSAEPHRFGGIAFKFGRRELGHLHGDRLADIPFPKPVHDELLAAGRVQEHNWVPDSGWSSRYIRSQEDVQDVIELLRINYDRAARKAGLATG